MFPHCYNLTLSVYLRWSILSLCDSETVFIMLHWECFSTVICHMPAEVVMCHQSGMALSLMCLSAHCCVYVRHAQCINICHWMTVVMMALFIVPFETTERWVHSEWGNKLIKQNRTPRKQKEGKSAKILRTNDTVAQGWEIFFYRWRCSCSTCRHTL